MKIHVNNIPIDNVSNNTDNIRLPSEHAEYSALQSEHCNTFDHEHDIFTYTREKRNIATASLKTESPDHSTIVSQEDHTDNISIDAIHLPEIYKCNLLDKSRNKHFTKVVCDHRNDHTQLIGMADDFVQMQQMRML